MIWRQESSSGGTELWVGNTEDSFHGYVTRATFYSDCSPLSRAYRVGILNAHVTILRLSRQSKDAFTLLLLGQVTPEGRLGDTKTTSYSSGREYSSLPVRGFDHYVSPDQQTLWYLRIHGEGSNSPLNKTHYTFATREPINVLENTGIRFVTHSGLIPIGPANCDISPHGIVLVG